MNVWVPSLFLAVGVLKRVDRAIDLGEFGWIAPSQAVLAPLHNATKGTFQMPVPLSEVGAVLDRQGKQNRDQCRASSEILCQLGQVLGYGAGAASRGTEGTEQMLFAGLRRYQANVCRIVLVIEQPSCTPVDVSSQLTQVGAGFMVEIGQFADILAHSLGAPLTLTR